LVHYRQRKQPLTKIAILRSKEVRKVVLNKDADGHITIKFYRKHCRKARYRRWAERQKKSLDRDHPGWHGLIIW